MAVSYTPEQIIRILARFEDYSDDLAWVVEDGALTQFWVPCSDIFMRAADGETIMPDDFDALDRAYRDSSEHSLWPMLWIARKRGQRPMEAVLARWRTQSWAKAAVPLFEGIDKGAPSKDDENDRP